MDKTRADAPARTTRRLQARITSETVEVGVLYIVMALMAAAFFIPFVWLVLSAFKENPDLFRNPPRWLPSKWTLENFRYAFTTFPFFLYLRNTLTIVLFNIIGGLLSNTLVAYGFSRIQWRGRNQLFYLVLLTMVLPFQITMIPLFMLFQKLGWVGTLLPLIVPNFFGNAFFIFLMRQFLVGIPNEISESARVDGANELMICLRVVVPLAKPALLSVAIFSFINAWNDFIGPLVFLTNSKFYTLAIGVQQLMSKNDPRWPALIALGVAMTAPILFIFFFMQKYFIEGITFAGVKG